MRSTIFALSLLLCFLGISYPAESSNPYVGNNDLPCNMESVLERGGTIIEGNDSEESDSNDENSDEEEDDSDDSSSSES